MAVASREATAWSKGSSASREVDQTKLVWKSRLLAVATPCELATKDIRSTRACLTMTTPPFKRRFCERMAHIASTGNDDVWQGVSAAEKVEKVIDWQRMRTQVLEPLLANKTASWHPLDFQPGIGWVGWKNETVILQPAPVILVDGVYSARPELADLVDLAVLVEANDEERRKRLVLREGQGFMQRWHALWDSAEEYYFTHICPPLSFDMVVRNDE